MDFFAQQEESRRRSVRLTVVAVVFAAVVLLATGAIFTVSAWCAWSVIIGKAEPFPDFVQGCPYVAMFSYLAAFAVMSLSGLLACQNIGSGNALMRCVGARKARRADDEQRIFNIVEEMSIASGVDMPDVWVIDDDEGVNAFAAGYGGGDSALCLTAGALRYLTRDELQGVVAHEFGHILNGDMRFNSHLVLLVEGLSGVSTLGRTMVRPVLHMFDPGEDEDVEGGGPYSAHVPRIGGGRHAAGGIAFLFVIYFMTGCALWLLGCVGTLFARILQPAASREREQLADAAAVQFTRNPEGLADALRFTRLLSGHRWRNPGASAINICHMFFVGEGWGVRGTHPPVKERVRRLSRLPLAVNDRAFRVRIAAVRRDRERRIQLNHERYLTKQDAHAKLVREPVAFPPDVNAQLKSASGAGAVLCALLRGEPVEGWSGQMSHAARRELAYRAVSAIRTWGTEAEIAAWSDRIEGLVKGQDDMGSFEFAVWCSVRRRLRGLPPGMFRRPGQLVREAACAVATVASFGKDPCHACELAAKRLDPFFPGFLSHACPYESASQFAQALEALRSLAAPVKRELLFAVRDAIAEDGMVTDDESNYLSAIADSICADGWDLACDVSIRAP